MNMVPTRRRMLGILGAIALTLSVDGTAADRGERSGHDHERARQALERGDILSLEQVLAAVRQRFAGEIIEVELEREDGIWIYELKLLRPNGRISELYVDGTTARIVKEEGH